jgi:hypothetical protein
VYGLVKPIVCGAVLRYLETVVVADCVVVAGRGTITRAPIRYSYFACIIAPINRIDAIVRAAVSNLELFVRPVSKSDVSDSFHPDDTAHAQPNIQQVHTVAMQFDS